jgi:5-formyltetrahydrofolate cyclo-ligase
MAKKSLRQTLRHEIHEFQTLHGAAADKAILRLFFETQHLMPQSVVGGYIALKGEVSGRDIFTRLNKQGHITSLPVVIERDAPMIFRAYRPGEPTRRGMLGQQEPLPHADEVMPDLLVIPMLGFTRQGYRLGYGSGFYDRTLPNLRAIKSVKTVGLAYSIQELPEFPVEPHDVPLDIIITEKEVIRIK